MARDEIIGIRVRLRDARRYMADAKAAARETKRIGDEAKRAHDKAGSGRGFGMFRREINATGRASRLGASQIRRAAGAAAAFGAGLLTIAKGKQAVNTTVDLAKTTLGLHRNLGLSIDTASQWAAVARARNVDAKQLNMSFAKLSGAANAAVKGDEKMIGMFQQLGITQADLREGQTDFNSLILKTAEGFGKMEGGTKRVEAGQKLMGRGWQTLLPLFAGGEKSLRDQMNLAVKYGATFGDSTAEKMKNLIAAQREAKFASMGLEVAFGTHVAPALTKVILGISRFVLGIRKGTGAGGRFRETVMTKIVEPAKQMWGWIKKNTDVLKALGAAFLIYKTARLLVATFYVMKIALIGIRVAFLAFKTAIILTRVAMIGLNVALLANPIGLVVAAVFLIVGGFYLLYTRVTAFRNFVNKWWPLLVPIFGVVLSPILAVGFAIYKIATNARTAWNWIRNAFNNVVGFVSKLPGRIGKAATGMWDGIKSAFRSAINWIINAWNNLEFKIPGFDPPGPGPKFGGISIGTPNIPTLGVGGIARQAGAALVGERGPELLRLERGARVDPLPRGRDSAGRIPIEPIDFQASGAIPTVLAKLYLNGREIAEAVATEIENKRAFS